LLIIQYKVFTTQLINYLACLFVCSGVRVSWLFCCAQVEACIEIPLCTKEFATQLIIIVG